MTECRHASEGEDGLPPRHIDPITAELARAAYVFEAAQKARKAAEQRGDSVGAGWFQTVEVNASSRLGKLLRSHVLWPFLSERKGLGGPLVARVIALIGDPRRFPGQKCSMGHTLPPLFEVGSPCPITATEIRTESECLTGGGEVSSNTDRRFESDEVDGVAGVSNQAESGSANDSVGGLVGSSDTDYPPEIEIRAGVGDSHTADVGRHESAGVDVRCVGVMLPPRPHSGVRSLWHYAGLHVIGGKLPRRRKTVQADWNPTLRTLALQPNGIADQIIKHRTEPYRAIYDAARERGKFYSVARAIAAKAFLGDLLTEWKRLSGGPNDRLSSDDGHGPTGEPEAGPESDGDRGFSEGAA